MTVNYFIKCPVCGKITRMRSPAGYVYSTPVRIHCGNCGTLLTGEFISDNKKLKAYFTPKNCETVNNSDYKYNYIGEAAGEMICNKVQENKTGEYEMKISPVIGFIEAFSLNDRENFINYAFYLSKLSDNWDDERIKYDLYLNNQYELLIKKYTDIANSFGYNLTTKFDCTRFIYFSCFRDMWGLYNESVIKRLFRDINYEFCHIDKAAILGYANNPIISNRLQNAQEAMLSILFEYIKIGQNLIPAIGLSNYYNNNSVNKREMGISTCTFTDISTYYQNTYESLVEYSDIIVALDNLKYRNDYNSCQNDKTLLDYKELSKGNKIKNLNQNEFFENTFNIDSSANKLRNAIGHNDYKYDGITQTIEYFVDKNHDSTEKQYLIDICLECVDLTRSLLVILFCLYEIFRVLNSYENNTLPKFFYSQTNSKNRCPCGSNLKYRNCCKNIDKVNISSKDLFDNVANCAVDAKTLLDSIEKQYSILNTKTMFNKKQDH